MLREALALYLLWHLHTYGHLWIFPVAPICRPGVLPCLIMSWIGSPPCSWFQGSTPLIFLHSFKQTRWWSWYFRSPAISGLSGPAAHWYLKHLPKGFSKFFLKRSLLLARIGLFLILLSPYQNSVGNYSITSMSVLNSYITDDPPTLPNPIQFADGFT